MLAAVAAAEGQEVLVPQAVKPIVNMQMVATQHMVLCREILLLDEVVVAGLAGHLQQPVPMPNMAEEGAVPQGTAHLIVLVGMAVLLCTEEAVVQVVDRKVETPPGPLAIGEVIQPALVLPHEPQTRQGSQGQVENSEQGAVALAVVVQMEGALVKLAAQGELHQAAAAAAVLLIQARAAQGEQAQKER
jgi:hypothetical protein